MAALCCCSTTMRNWELGGCGAHQAAFRLTWCDTNQILSSTCLWYGALYLGLSRMLNATWTHLLLEASRKKLFPTSLQEKHGSQ